MVHGATLSEWRRIVALVLLTASVPTTEQGNYCATTANDSDWGERHCDTVAGRSSTKHPTFDDLDFNVFSNQKWDELSRSHSKNILVHWPDGHTTQGIEKHIEDLKAMFVYAPDTRIKEHPIKFGSGQWTAVTGIMEGKFTRPMPMGGKTIPPTGKAFRLPMCTIGRWENGVMVEEYLYWDNPDLHEADGSGTVVRRVCGTRANVRPSNVHVAQPRDPHGRS